MGRAEGAVQSFTTIDDPVVTTLAVTDAAQTTATLRGNITSNGGGTISAAGFKYGTSASLAVFTSAPSSAIGGTYTTALTSLAENTTYYYHAYATNEASTVSGDTLSFTTVGPCDNIFSVTYEGYSYDLIEAGGNCWFAENLRTTLYADQSSIPRCAPVAGFTSNIPSSGTSFSCSNELANNYGAAYGFLYPAEAFSSGFTYKEVCPSGWSRPTQSDWTALLASVGNDVTLLMSATQWAGTAEGNIGFNALPGGLTDDDGSGGGVQGEFFPGAQSLPATASGGNAYFWTDGGVFLIIGNTQASMVGAVTGWPYPGGNFQGAQHNRASVRCVKD